MTKKILLGIFLVAISAITFKSTVLAATDETTARQTAEKWVPPSATHVLTKEEKNEYEVKFLDKDTGVSYEVEISKLTGAVTEVKTEISADPGSMNVKLNQTDVENIVRSEFPNAVIHQIELDNDNGYRHFDVKFTAGAIRGKMEINPETGIIIERELKY